MVRRDRAGTPSERASSGRRPGSPVGKGDAVGVRGRARWWSSIPRLLPAPENPPSWFPVRRFRRFLIGSAVALMLGQALPAAAQTQRFRLFAAVGLQFLAHPELRLGRGAGLAGSAALRANDTWSLELGGFFGRSNRRYTATDEPVEDVIAEAAYEFRTNRYHLDGSVVYHLGRRQPFQMYFLAGGGIVRRDETKEDFVYADPEPPGDGSGGGLTGFRRPIDAEVSLKRTTYAASAHLAAGIEVYVFDDLSARAEYRIWWPGSFSYRTQQVVIGVNYYR